MIVRVETSPAPAGVARTVRDGPLSYWCAAVALGAACLGFSPEAAADPEIGHVRTWDGASVAWTVTGADLRGLSVESAGQPSLIGWHRVRGVPPSVAGESEPFLEIGRAAWRASTRLERGDAYGAEPLFESLFERFRGVEGPTAALVAEGLMRCRLRREARASAVDAWLDLYENLSAAPAREPRWGLESSAIDGQSLLAPSLPPIWFAGPAASAFSARLDEPVSPDDVAGAIRALYAAAARWALGDPIDAEVASRAASIAARREASDFIAAMVLAQAGGEQARRDARLMLERERAGDAPSWRRAWATIAIGRSLVAEPDESSRRRGVIELVSVHALDRDPGPFQAWPYLAGVGLADAALACDALGDADAAAVLLDELFEAAPSHPVQDSPRVVELADRLHGRAQAR